MEAILGLTITQAISRPTSARPVSTRRQRVRRVQSARRWIDDSPQTTARTMEN